MVEAPLYGYEYEASKKGEVFCPSQLSLFINSSPFITRLQSFVASTLPPISLSQRLILRSRHCILHILNSNSPCLIPSLSIDTTASREVSESPETSPALVTDLSYALPPLSHFSSLGRRWNPRWLRLVHLCRDLREDPELWLRSNWEGLGSWEIWCIWPFSPFIWVVQEHWCFLQELRRVVHHGAQLSRLSVHLDPHLRYTWKWQCYIHPQPVRVGDNRLCDLHRSEGMLLTPLLICSWLPCWRKIISWRIWSSSTKSPTRTRNSSWRKYQSSSLKLLI